MSRDPVLQLTVPGAERGNVWYVGGGAETGPWGRDTYAAAQWTSAPRSQIALTLAALETEGVVFESVSCDPTTVTAIGTAVRTDYSASVRVLQQEEKLVIRLFPRGGAEPTETEVDADCEAELRALW